MLECLFEKHLETATSEVSNKDSRTSVTYWYHFGVIIGNCELIQRNNFTGCTPGILKYLVLGDFH